MLQMQMLQNILQIFSSQIFTYIDMDDIDWWQSFLKGYKAGRQGLES